MIPTAITNSPPSACLAQNIAGVSTAVAGGSSSQTNYSSIVLGLASLILEGRPISDDEYKQQTVPPQSSPPASQQQRTRDWLEQQEQRSGRISPSPSTSRACLANASVSGMTGRRVINITANPHALSMALPPYAYGVGLSSSAASGSSPPYMFHECTNSTHQRWTQKLCQLRQVSPAPQSMSAETELVTVANCDPNTEHGVASDFDIMRRVIFNRGSVASAIGTISAASSPGSGSENILHSLQSLATTCLRGSTPATTAEPLLQTRNRNVSLGVSLHGTEPAGLPTSPYRSHGFLDFSWSRSEVQSTGVGTALRTRSRVGRAKPINTQAAEATNLPGTATPIAKTRPKHGPHCDQFLRKMGLAKGEVADAEEHFCDMSYINITCSRWRAWCQKMEAIVSRQAAVCIEVYLGPVGHKILLEQWIITGRKKVPPPTMTLPSLCSAIRSQLYFSQIVAWCDLLRKCDQSIYDTGRIIFASDGSANTTAGDLATPTHSANLTPRSSPGETHPPLTSRSPRLNIFYQIKQYDDKAHGDAGFSAKPNMHNFPHVNIAENLSISVSVKSLPRINGGIPRIRPSMNPTSVIRGPTESRSNDKLRTTKGGGFCATAPTSFEACTDKVSGEAKFSPKIKDVRGAAAFDYGKQQQKRYQRQRQQQSQRQPQCDKLDEREGMCCKGSNVLTHREKQLQKYRKRMLKRDKKRERKPSAEESELDLKLKNGCSRRSSEPMDEVDLETDDSRFVSGLVSGGSRSIEMISTGTQTPLTSCQICGSEKTFLCLNCSIAEDDTGSEMEELDESSCSLSSSDLIVGTPRNKAELLLQAIQRTPKNKQLHQQHQQKSQLVTSRAVNDLNGVVMRHNNNHVIGEQNKAGPTSGCQVCKRQKTQHNFSKDDVENKTSTPSVPCDKRFDTKQNEDNVDDGKNGSSNSQPKAGTVVVIKAEPLQVLMPTTKLSPHIERCSLGTTRTDPLLFSSNSNTTKKLQLLGINCDDEGIVVQFKTPTSTMPLKLLDSQRMDVGSQRKQTHYQSVLQINCSSDVAPITTPQPGSNSFLLRKALPKVNLTTIFCNTNSSAVASSATPGLHSAPIIIGASSGNVAFSFEPTELNLTQSQSTVTMEDSNIPVQKSYSAPTLPNSLSLSPRFAKQAAFYKRRSRHLSDRSDRSSLGSDEQLSDEEFESGMCSPATSPLKSRSRIAAQFGRRPLLGNLEESLLQKRLLPKIEVMGFKVLLGASGGFCPTQLTIPASAYFYELHGETLSTPYLCEIRLPRKGYFVPRLGTVQVTLLNPMGMVVRMFVIPYDMRDMPPLHRTFIRQRILAEESSSASVASSGSITHDMIGLCNSAMGSSISSCTNDSNMEQANAATSSKLGHFIGVEQMKRLRYSIHLRFQTSRSGRLSLHTDIRLLISRRTDCDTAAAHAAAKEEDAPNELITDTLSPTEPRYSARQENPSKI